MHACYCEICSFMGACMSHAGLCMYAILCRLPGVFCEVEGGLSNHIWVITICICMNIANPHVAIHSWVHIITLHSCCREDTNAIGSIGVLLTANLYLISMQDVNWKVLVSHSASTSGSRTIPRDTNATFECTILGCYEDWFFNAYAISPLTCTCLPEPTQVEEGQQSLECA